MTVLRVHGAALSVGWFLALFAVTLVETTPALRRAARAALAGVDVSPTWGAAAWYGVMVLVVPAVWLVLTVVGVAELVLAQRIRRGGSSAATMAAAVWVGVAAVSLAGAVGGLPAPWLLLAVAVVHVGGALLFLVPGNTARTRTERVLS